MMFKIVYSLLDSSAAKEDICGFELGYIAFVAGNQDENLYGLENQPSMIFLTISELLSGLTEYEEKQLDAKEIVGVDSSLRIRFSRAEQITRVLVNGRLLITVGTPELLRAMYHASADFCRIYDASLCGSVKADLNYALTALWELIEGAEQ